MHCTVMSKYRNGPLFLAREFGSDLYLGARLIYGHIERVLLCLQEMKTADSSLMCSQKLALLWIYS